MKAINRDLKSQTAELEQQGIGNDYKEKLDETTTCSEPEARMQNYKKIAEHKRKEELRWKHKRAY